VVVEMTSTTTKERILDAAEAIMLKKGFHAVGLSEILAAVKVPKGSFYHHFSSKEQFGVELINHYVGKHLERLSRFFGSRDASAMDKFAEYWAYIIGRMTEAECQQCCLLVKMALEVANFSEPMRAAFAAGMQASRSVYERAIREGQGDGSIRKQADALQMSAIIQMVWQGALQRMLVDRSVAPLRTAAQFLRGCLAAE
jgi:TetR/AcrR family transcriptional regulator, transcriptional repressor for nem operon